MAEDLRARLNRPGADYKMRLSLIDALASMVEKPNTRPTTAQRIGIRAAMASIAWPLRKPEDSPAWRRLDDIGGQTFDRDLARLLVWIRRAYGLGPEAARLSINP